MRSISERLDPRRVSGTKCVRSKYIFAFEGFSTEIAYFEGLMEHRSVAGIRDLVSICILQREDIDSGCSDPMVLLGILGRHIDSMVCGRHTLDTMSDAVKGEIGKTLGWNRNDRRLVEIESDIRKSLVGLSDENGFIKDHDVAVANCEKIVKDRLNRNLQLNIHTPESYDPDTDHICILIDRDRESHSPQKIDEFLSNCRERGFEPYITNPCFEFWLILHFSRSYRLDRETLSQNPLIGDRRFTEVELDCILNEVNQDYHYDKTHLDPLMFLHRINDAVNNSKTYCNNLKCLKHEVGTNLGSLFENICTLR